jgi:thiol-disulfide isomerase/thioredoxin
MRKIAYLVGCLILIGNIGLAQKKMVPNQPDYRKKGAPLPPFVLQKTAGGTFTNTNLKPGKPVMMMIFSPQCEHCAYVIDSLKQTAAMFKNTQFVLVAEDRNKQFMKDFIKKADIGTHPLFKNTGTEKGNLIYYIYNYQVLPQVNFYNSNYKLEKSFTGTAPFDSLKMFIR